MFKSASLTLAVLLAAGCSLHPVAPESVSPQPSSPAIVDVPADEQAVNPFDQDADLNADDSSDDAADDTVASDSENADVPASDSVWDEFRRYTLLDLTVENPRIKAQRDWYLSNADYMNRVIDRAEPYLYYVQSEINRRGLPSELLLLPIVESAYDPFAYSHGRAAGMWQFIPGTGRLLGLKQTWWYEGRRDIVASTDAAFNYLDTLQKRFNGDWLLALAAYNAGAGNIQKAINKNRRKGKPTDFWSLDLRPETSAYVPKLIALAQIFNDPDRYQFALRDVPYEPYFAVVDVKSQIDLAQAANMAGISIEELYQLNPGFNRWATDPKGPHRLLVPIANADQFQTELDSLPPEKRVQWTRYTIRSGDTVSSITKNFHITPDLLRSVNGMSGNRLRAGHTLLIPQSTQPLHAYALSADQRLQKKLSRNISGKKKIIHTVAGGESLWQISRRFHVNVRDLARWNGMAPGDPLSQGRKLVIWKSSAFNVASSNPMAKHRMRKIRYRARSGDSYAGIADKFNVSLHQIKRWNKVNLDKYLQPGDSLTLYVDVANAP